MNVFAGRCDLDENGEAIDEQCSDSISLCKQGMDCTFVFSGSPILNISKERTTFSLVRVFSLFFLHICY